MPWSLRFLVIFLAFAPFASRATASGPRHAEDAALRSVFFIDSKEGWAVGDEGVILHTFDSGKSWHIQQTGVRASLRSVQFLTPLVGWAVGREELPYGMGSVGVVLFTDDGGLEWKQQLANTIPGINQIRFTDEKAGYLLGDGSDRFPSGIFRTTDSGRSWEPVPGPRAPTWLTGDFQDAKTGMLAGGWSRLATLRNDRCTLAEHAYSLSGRDITSLQILGKKKTLAVAQGGLILTSASDGAAWNYATTKLPTEVLANLDYHALHAVHDKVWVVGRPGSVVLHSTDAGASWSLQKTGQSMPLHGVFFFDDRYGWAVGDAGTVLATTDGGRSWTTQHQAGKRAAVLCVHALSKDAPVDTLAQLGAAEGYLATSLCVTAPDSATIAWGRPHDSRRYAAATRRAGAVAGEMFWHFPMPQHLEGCDKKTILAHWDQLHKANQAADELVRQLVLTLRIWRPSVVLCEHPDSRTPLNALVGEAMQEAVRQAGDPKAFPEQIDTLGLPAWQVTKIYALGGDRNSTLTQDNNTPSVRLQSTVREFAATAHALLTDRYTTLPKERTHTLLTARKDTGPLERHWLEGLDQKVGESKRDVKVGELGDEKLTQALTHRRAALALAENLDDPSRTMVLLQKALDKLPDEHAAPVAFAVAGQFAERGQWLLAQEVYLYLVEGHPAHPLSAEAYRWLIRFNSSGEARRRHELKHFMPVNPIGFTKKITEDLDKEKNPIQRVGHDDSVKGMPANLTTARDWNKGSLELIKRLGGFGPSFAFEPSTQFCLQSAKRHIGDVSTMRDWMTKFRGFIPEGPWHDTARAELWLADRSEAVPRRVGRSRYTEVRPFLDGKFDDPCWQDVKPMILDNAVGDSAKNHATEAMFAFDQEFLYVALKCKHPAGQRVLPVKPRARDADLDAFDRVSILFDLDRDYATYFHLEVDQRGCVRDSCWGDKTWNPRWFVAVHSTETDWQIEAAIPLAELTGERITQQTAWAFNLVRVLPGRGVQSWSQPADVRPRPEGMSLLLFQTGGARPMSMQPAP